MEYVIFDLEWDSVFYKPEKKFINQILQIGAVRLDSNFNVIGEYEATIRSAISKKVSKRFAELTGITTEKMQSGVPFSVAVQGFNDFSKGADVTMTWSDSDLHTIVENEILLEGTGLSFEMNFYLDLQKLVQAKMRTIGYDSKNQVALDSAAEFFGIDIKDFAMHTARDDSAVCAKLLKECYDEKVFCSLLRDAKNPEFNKRLHFKPYPITDINDKSLDKAQFNFECPKCECKINRISKWKYRNRWFSAPCKCPQCGGKFISRVYPKMTFDGVVYKRRITELKKKEPQNEMQSVPETVQ